MRRTNKTEQTDRRRARAKTLRHGSDSAGKLGRIVHNEHYKDGRLRAKHLGISTAIGFFARIRAAMNPACAYSPVRTLADMSEEEKRAIEIRLGAKIGRPGTPTT